MAEAKLCAPCRIGQVVFLLLIAGLIYWVFW